MNSSDEIILAIDFGAQRSTLINIDKNGNSLRPAISRLDQRQTAPGKYPEKLMQLALRVAGMWEAVIYAVKNGECNRLNRLFSGHLRIYLMQPYIQPSFKTLDQTIAFHIPLS
jgi:hypothetical protein